MIRVLVVDDHAMVRAGLSGMLAAGGDVEVVAEAGDGASAVELAVAHRPEVVLMDLSMPGMDGIQATRAVLAEHPAAAIVILTSFSDRHQVRRALDAGAIGYQLKDAEPDVLREAVRAAARGDVPLDARVARVLLETRAPAADPLSAREREVLELVADGLANKQIARRLGITERTVKAHLGSAYRQIGVGDRTSAALWLRDDRDRG